MTAQPTHQRGKEGHGAEGGAAVHPGLEVCGLVKHFGGVQAVRGVSFMVQPGECVALIGPNGAGKSTTFACIAGQQRPSAGQVLWGGVPLERWDAAQRLRSGIARSFQVAQTFEALTVLQNVQLLLQYPAGVSALRVLDGLHTELAHALLAQVGLADAAAAHALHLPYGAKKRLELAMALAAFAAPARAATSVATSVAARAHLLLLDEPAAGLAASERAALMRLVKSLVAAPSAAPLSVLYTEHNMDAVFGVADRVLVLMDGVLAAQGTPQAVANNPVVRARYLGVSFAYTQTNPEANAEVHTQGEAGHAAH